MISEIVKKIDIKTTPLLIAVLTVLVVARFCYSKNSTLLELGIILLSVYLTILFVQWVYTFIRKRMQYKKERQAASKKKAIKAQQTDELIWNYFLCLSNRQLQTLIDLISLPEAGSKYKRVVQPMSILMTQLSYNHDFQIRTHNNWFLPLLTMSNNYEPDAPMVVDIEPILYKFIEHYMATGKKEHV